MQKSRFKQPLPRPPRRSFCRLGPVPLSTGLPLSGPGPPPPPPAAPRTPSPPHPEAHGHGGALGAGPRPPPPPLPRLSRRPLPRAPARRLQHGGGERHGPGPGGRRLPPLRALAAGAMLAPRLTEPLPAAHRGPKAARRRFAAAGLAPGALAEAAEGFWWRKNKVLRLSRPPGAPPALRP